MRKLLLLSTALFVASTSSLAHAQTGMNLSWNNCITQSNAAEDKAYACDGSANGTPFKIVFSFFTPVALSQFVGIQATVEVHTTSETLSDWWRLGVGECREGNLGFPGSMSGIGTGTTGACRGPWVGGNVGGGMMWLSGSDTSDVPTGQGRVVLAYARDNEQSLNTGQQYVGGVMTLDTYNDTEGEYPECSGCSEPICIVLTEIQLFQTPGAAGGDIQTITEAETRRAVTWQGGVASCPGASESRHVMWGSIRAVYR
jgi:hypothetical protein